METPQPPGAPRSNFSPDGLWWWDGTAWKAAVSPDGRWRWDGTRWAPNQAQPYAAPRPGGGGSKALIITLVSVGGVLLLVFLLTVVVLYTMGGQISNVFSNVAAALGSSPSP